MPLGLVYGITESQSLSRHMAYYFEVYTYRAPVPRVLISASYFSYCILDIKKLV